MRVKFEEAARRPWLYPAAAALLFGAPALIYSVFNMICLYLRAFFSYLQINDLFPIKTASALVDLALVVGLSWVVLPYLSKFAPPPHTHTQQSEHAARIARTHKKNHKPHLSTSPPQIWQVQLLYAVVLFLPAFILSALMFSFKLRTVFFLTASVSFCVFIPFLLPTIHDRYSLPGRRIVHQAGCHLAMLLLAGCQPAAPLLAGVGSRGVEVKA